MRYRFLICDVFTSQRFGGNQLAVLPEASGLSTEQMQQVAREFNFSESTFVLPSATCTRQVRIFTPAAELPFAGHPNVGTAFVLASIGELGEIGNETTVTFDEKAGRVPVRVRRTDAGFHCTLSAPQPLAIGKSVDVSMVAKAVSIAPDDFVTATHRPQSVGVGLPFLLAEVRGRDVLERMKVNVAGFEALRAEGVPHDVLFYARAAGDADIRARMFAPLDGILEDPATGSANCALGAMLCHYTEAASGTFAWRIAQGVEMGRPSLLLAEADKRDGQVVAARIGGDSVLVADGSIEVG